MGLPTDMHVSHRYNISTLQHDNQPTLYKYFFGEESIPVETIVFQKPFFRQIIHIYVYIMDIYINKSNTYVYKYYICMYIRTYGLAY